MSEDELIPKEISICSHRPWKNCCTSLTNVIAKLNDLRILLLEIALASQSRKFRSRGKDVALCHSAGPGSRSWTPVMGEDELGHFGYLLEKVAKQFLQGEAPPDEVFSKITVADVWLFNIYSSVGGAILCMSKGASKNKSRSSLKN